MPKDSYRHFERAKTRARLREQHSKALEKNIKEVELEQARRNGIQRAILHDHTYANSEGELVEEPLSEELVTHEEHSDQELLSDECKNENKELNRELLREIKDAGIPVEVGKTRFSNGFKALHCCLFALTECQTGLLLKLRLVC